jgi:hypothetical protein
MRPVREATRAGTDHGVVLGMHHRNGSLGRLPLARRAKWPPNNEWQRTRPRFAWCLAAELMFDRTQRRA